MTVSAIDPDRPAGHTLRKAGAENFPVAPRFLPRAWRDDLLAVYGYARLVDDIGDGDLAPGGADALLLGADGGADAGPGALLDALEADLRRAFRAAGHPAADATDAAEDARVAEDAHAAEGTHAAPDAGEAPRHPLLRALVPTVRRARLSPEPFLGLLAANRMDQRVHRYADRDELLAYCELSANPVGRLVLAVTGTTTPERVRRSDAVCTALQIIEHLQDVPEDLARGRIYLPAEDLARHRVTPEDLAAPTANASVRALIAAEAAWARRLLDEGAPLVGSTRGRLRLLLAGYVGGGRAALAALAAARYDVLARTPKATAPALLRAVGTTLRRGM